MGRLGLALQVKATVKIIQRAKALKWKFYQRRHLPCLFIAASLVPRKELGI